MATKMTVQFNLFAGTVLKLGTQKHHDLLLRGIDTLDDVGCFALTELGFGACPSRCSLFLCWGGVLARPQLGCFALSELGIGGCFSHRFLLALEGRGLLVGWWHSLSWGWGGVGGELKWRRCLL